ncbi:MAG TPA: radical SAM protein [Gemmatimonadales bacterium]|nr:radical SAM protein [Gemmatimonadales bacterium]
MSRLDHPRILLVAPTATDDAGRPITQRRLHLPGLTLPMLAAVTPAGCDVRLVHETVEPVPFDERWDLVGITGMGSGLVRAWGIADEFRRRGCTVVIGGIAATLVGPARSLEHADAVVSGEAEETWPELVRDFEAGRLRRTYRAAAPPPIDALPVPRYDLLDRRTLGRWRPVQATRGCPHICDFCSVTAFFGARQRRRPVDQVVRDVRAAKRHGTRYIAFVDDNIGVDREYCAALWEALVPEKILWMSQCSLHVAERPELLALARRSGCRLLSFGIESVSEESLAAHRKAWNRPGRYAAAIAAVRRAGIDVSTEMMVGLDGDDAWAFQRTYDFVMDNAISVPRVFVVTPIPGTPLFDRMKREGRLLGDDFSRVNGGQVIFRPRRLAPEQLQRGYWSLYRRMTSLGSIARRLLRNRASLGPYLRAFELGVNLHYRSHIRRGITPGIV